MKRRFNISKLVFVIGFPRSGTTWFANLIKSHPDTAYRHEALGRDGGSFGDELFRKLTLDYGLSDEDYATAVSILMKAKVETDKPPFFRKRIYRTSSGTVQMFVWMAARASRIFCPLYTFLFTPRPTKSVVLVLKETRSSVDLASIIAGIRVDKLVILIRHPYAVVASHMIGKKAGFMRTSTPEFRREWLKHHATFQYVRDARITEDYVLNVSEAEFVALGWRLQNDEYLRMHSIHPDSQLIVYEAFLSNLKRHTLDLLRFIGLDADDQVLQFAQSSSSVDAKKSGLLPDASSEYFSVFRTRQFDPNNWKTVLSVRELDLIDKHTGPLVRSLGLDTWIDHSEEREGGIGAHGYGKF